MPKILLADKPVFNAKEHTYTDPKDKFQYTSVTRWVEKFKYPFDEMDIAYRVARSQDVTVQTVLDLWKKKRDDSANFGTKVHKVLEVFLSKNKIIDSHYKEIINGFKALNISLDTKKSMFENLVYNRKYGIAGTSDIIIQNKDKKTFNVYDFKTNKQFRYTSPFGHRMLKPLEHFPCSEYYTYSLQLSMYAFLYKLMSGLEPLRLKIFWYERNEPENYEKVAGKWHIINIPYMEEEILKCLHHEDTEE